MTSQERVHLFGRAFRSCGPTDVLVKGMMSPATALASVGELMRSASALRSISNDIAAALHRCPADCRTSGAGRTGAEVSLPAVSLHTAASMHCLRIQVPRQDARPKPDLSNHFWVGRGMEQGNVCFLE